MDLFTNLPDLDVAADAATEAMPADPPPSLHNDDLEVLGFLVDAEHVADGNTTFHGWCVVA